MVGATVGEWDDHERGALERAENLSTKYTKDTKDTKKGDMESKSPGCSSIVNRLPIFVYFVYFVDQKFGCRSDGNCRSRLGGIVTMFCPSMNKFLLSCLACSLVAGRGGGADGRNAASP